LRIEDPGSRIQDRRLGIQDRRIQDPRIPLSVV